MKQIQLCFLILVFSMLSACTNTSSTDEPISDADNPFVGTYLGTEDLETGVYPIKIYVNAKGKVQIVDVDNISAYGNLNGNKFKIRRNNPFQMFEGEIADEMITGTTWGNQFVGDGTFSVTRQ